jgi:hypothetical protein
VSKNEYSHDSLQAYGKFLITRHHHEILPERLWLISRIKKANSDNEFGMYKARYELLETLHPNESWGSYVRKLIKNRGNI